ncbi:M28 family metallopeptidase [Aquimarina brevivitae]|uniref:Peptidase M28-like protein n=1 Tax=Aquimarina brevivitae TaxID=323412 RepID=A0A4Q7PI56_9FLAO|nr:M20/M25/M40 family metallo-hydrolase [Aquimarina brevivitae]RZS99897.1 peptidase M28-like protein [Aquimarina brevivitae]
MTAIKQLQYALVVTFAFVTIVPAKAQQAMESTDKIYVSETMTFLTADELQGRKSGTEGYQKAVDYTANELKSMGITPFFDAYTDEFEAQGKTTYNVVGYLEGTDKDLAKEFVIIGAHLDHIGSAKPSGGDTIANGANDNASGSTAVLTLAKHFAAQKANKRSILFVLFGAEEMGLLGSAHLAKKLKEKNVDVYTMINFEMIGVPLNEKSYMAYLTGFELTNMAEKINAYAEEEIIGYLPKAKEYQLFKRSDNYPFYKEYKIPAQTISTFDFTNYDYYHHADDEAEYMNYEFMAKLIDKMKTPLLSIINTDKKEIVMKENQ